MDMHKNAPLTPRVREELVRRVLVEQHRPRGKRAKTLSEAVELLHSFKQRNHIDPDLFDLFLTSGVYRRYAEKFLNPEQIDEVDISKYVRAD